MKQGDYEYSYQVFKKGVYRDGTSETGSIVYHVTGAEGVDALTLLINNRACNGAKIHCFDKLGWQYFPRGSDNYSR